MEGIQYDVSAVLKVAQAGAFHTEMGRAAKGADTLQGALDKLNSGAQTFAGGLSTLVSRTTAVVGGLATATVAATAAGTALAVAHVGKNLSMLEDKGIQLTAVVAAATEQQFGAVRGETDKLFAGFREDAVKSAGETQDFVDTASKLAGPLLGAGKSMADLREITKGVIATAPALGVKFEQAGSDVMRMLQGSAGADLPFFKALQSIPSLGVQSAEAFNKLDIGKRVEIVRKALTNPAFLAASDAAGDSFSGLISTSQDLAKTMGGLAVSPAFGAVKRGLKSVTSTIIEGLGEKGALRGSLETLGERVGHRFEQVGQQLGRIFPDLNGSLAGTVDLVTRLADQGMARVVWGATQIADHWPEITAQAAKFAGWIDHAADRGIAMVRALGGGDMVKGLERAGLLLAGGHAAAPVGSMAMGGLQMAQGAFSLGRLAMGAGGAATAAEAAAGAGGAAAGASAGGAGAAGAALGGAGALASGGILAGVAAFVATAYLAIEQDTFGFFGILRQQWDTLMETGESLRRNLSGLWGQLGQLSDAGGQLWTAVRPLAGVFASIYAIPLAAFFEGVVGALQMTADVVNVLAKNLQMVAMVATEATGKLTSLVDAVVDKLGLKKPTLAAQEDDLGRREQEVVMLGVVSGMAAAGNVGGPGAKPKPNDKGSQKVDVTIKWDLGEGNEEAIYVRSRRDITEMTKNARGFVRASPLAGRFSLWRRDAATWRSSRTCGRPCRRGRWGSSS